MPENLIHVIATRLDSISSDMQDMKSSQKELTAAFGKMMLIEERITNNSAAQTRLFKLLDALEARIDTLEKAAPMQAQASQWVIAAVYGAAGLAVMFVAKNVGLI